MRLVPIFTDRGLVYVNPMDVLGLCNTNDEDAARGGTTIIVSTGNWYTSADINKVAAAIDRGLSS